MAEDNPEDALLLEESFRAENLPVVIECVSDGEQLLNRLRQPGFALNHYSLIVLDAHLPRRSAEEVLATLHAGQGALHVPVVILSSMISDSQRDQFLQLGVAAVITKPLDLDEYIALARTLYAIASSD